MFDGWRRKVIGESSQASSFCRRAREVVPGVLQLAHEKSNARAVGFPAPDEENVVDVAHAGTMRVAGLTRPAGASRTSA